MESLDQPSYFFNRELSLLEFNQRVLEQGKNKENPLLERAKFLSIVSSNLDEFFMVACCWFIWYLPGKVQTEDMSGRSPIERMKESLFKTRTIVSELYQTYDALLDELKEYGIELVKYEELDQKTKGYMDYYYQNQIYPVLTPMVIDQARPFPLI